MGQLSAKDARALIEDDFGVSALANGICVYSDQHAQLTVSPSTPSLFDSDPDGPSGVQQPHSLDPSHEVTLWLVSKSGFYGDGVVLPAKVHSTAPSSSAVPLTGTAASPPDPAAANLESFLNSVLKSHSFVVFLLFFGWMHHLVVFWSKNI